MSGRQRAERDDEIAVAPLLTTIGFEEHNRRHLAVETRLLDLRNCLRIEPHGMGVLCASDVG